MPHSMTSCSRTADITALITTYNQDLKSTLVSLASAALQKNLDVQILIADDCSRVDSTQAYARFLDYLGQRNYRIVRHERNVQTVRNIVGALPYARSPIVKCFGAGDLLYSFDTLSHIVSALSTSHVCCGFGNLIAFNQRAEGGVRFQAPRNPEQYSSSSSLALSKLFSQQMLTADWIPGCCQFWQTKKLAEMLDILSSGYRIRYCEDFAMTLALYEEIPCHLDTPTLWYDFGGGISTGGSFESVKRLYKDHSNFYSKAAEMNPFGNHLRAARLGFDIRRFVALHSPIYRALQVKVADRYQNASDFYPYNELFIKAHNLVDRFMTTQCIET